ncbi:MAG: DUF2378 family protein [Myxococcaceae bacterium]
MKQPAEPQRVVFSQGFEGLFSKDIRARVTPEFDAALRKLGIALDKPFQAAYPIELWAECVELASKHVYPDLPRPDAYRRLGADTIQGFGQTFIGKAVFGMLKLIGPVRAIERATRNYASTNNYTKVTLTRTSPTSFHFHLNEKHTLPEFDMGVVEEMLRYLGAAEPRVTLVQQDPEGFTMNLEWKG